MDFSTRKFIYVIFLISILIFNIHPKDSEKKIKIGPQFYELFKDCPVDITNDYICYDHKILIYDNTTENIEENIDNHFYVLNRNFKIIKDFNIPKGKGPGELMGVGDLTMYNNKIVIYDSILHRINLYTKNMKFIETFNMDKWIGNFINLDKDNIYSYKFKYGEEKVLGGKEVFFNIYKINLYKNKVKLFKKIKVKSRPANFITAYENKNWAIIRGTNELYYFSKTNLKIKRYVVIGREYHNKIKTGITRRKYSYIYEFRNLNIIYFKEKDGETYIYNFKEDAHKKFEKNNNEKKTVYEFFGKKYYFEMQNGKYYIIKY